jgi:hypothetical protein
MALLSSTHQVRILRGSFFGDERQSLFFAMRMRSATSASVSGYCSTPSDTPSSCRYQHVVAFVFDLT